MALVAFREGQPKRWNASWSLRIELSGSVSVDGFEITVGLFCVKSVFLNKECI
jgi:hypothetical protein